MNSICFSTDTGETEMMIKFSSLEILDTSQKVTSKWKSMHQGCNQANDAYDDIVDDFDGIVDLVTSQGGWTVYGWGKRGFINDVSISGNGSKEPYYHQAPGYHYPID